VRATTTISGIVLFALLVAGGVALAHRPPAIHAQSLTAARFVTVVANGPAADPPHVVSLPSPIPTAPPPVVTGGGPPAATAPARAPLVRSTEQALINQDRAAYGLGSLTWSACLYNVAVSNARRIAAQGYLSHTNGPQVDLSCGLGNRAGENIGDWSLGVNDTKLNSMFMASADHRANILGPFHYVATAWVVGANGAGYIAVEFG
jgi:uncharacterized protein YkwD